MCACAEVRAVRCLQKQKSIQFCSTNQRRIMDGTILKEILRNCSEYGDSPVYNWVNDKCDVERSVTYRELGERSQEIAEELLLSLQLRRGERVILCYPPGLDYILSLVACLRAGITAGTRSR